MRHQKCETSIAQVTVVHRRAFSGTPCRVCFGCWTDAVRYLRGRVLLEFVRLQLKSLLDD